MSWKTCEFGKYQKNFNRAKGFNGSIEELIVTSGQNNNGKYFSMIFLVGTYRFKVRFEKTNNGLNDIFKSVTYRTVEKGQEIKYELEPHYDENEFDEMCAEWLVEALFRKRYRFDKVSLMLPPRYESIMPGTCKHNIDELSITVGNDEEDEGIVDWWLSRFRSTVKFIKVTSDDVRIMINDNLILKHCSVLEICGKSDITIEFIKNYCGDYFIHRGNGKNNEFTDDQLKELCVYCNENHDIKGIYLQQGTAQKGVELRNWLEETYTDYKYGIDYYKRKKRREIGIFYFKMTHMEVTFGNFHGKEDSMTNPMNWQYIYMLHCMTTGNGLY